jgi:hypothetical protein
MEELLEGIVVAGVAAGPMISVIISILKNWANLPKKWIQPVNWLLAFAAIAGYNIIEAGEPWYMALVAALVAVVTSSGFHEVIGHNSEAIRDAIVKKSS